MSIFGGIGKDSALAALGKIESETLPAAAELANQIVANAVGLVNGTLEGMQLWANSAIERAEESGERLIDHAADAMHGIIGRCNGITVELKVPERKA